MPIFDPSTHDDLIDISITLSSLARGTASLTTALVLMDGISPGGGRVASYASEAEVAADVLLGNLNATSTKIATVMFGQENPPESVLFGQVGTLEVWTYQVNTATIAEVYGIDMTAPTAVDINITASAAVAATIASQIAAAWNANATCAAAATAVPVTDTVTFTSTSQNGLVLAEDENAAKTTLTHAADTLEAPDVALDACIADGANFYGVLYQSRTAARQVALATDIESKTADGVYLLFAAQSGDSSWLDSGIPSAWSTAAGYERTVVYYHDDNDDDAVSDRLDCAHFADRLSWDPDETSAGWTSAVAEVDALTTALTQTQKAFARANYANVALPFGTQTDTYVDPGKNLAGRPVDHIVSADWLRARTSEAVADLLVECAARGAKIPVDATGQAMVGAAIEAKFLQGEGAGHFLSHTLVPTPITSADIAAQRVRFSGQAQLATGIRTVVISLYFDTNPIA